MAFLPSTVCLKSVYNNKYLCYRDGDVQTQGLLQFSGDTVMDQLAQFEVVPATNCDDDGLVHLKSCYTNKFLVRWSPNHYWITASAEKPNQDQTDWACTLFRPSVVSGLTPKVRLLHVQLGHYACLWRIGAPFDSCLFAGSKDIDKDSCDLVTFTDWASVFKLSNHVAFKGDNGKYLGLFEDDRTPYLQFSYDDPNDPRVVQEVFTSDAGFVYIKSKYNGMFWRLGDEDWVVADLVEPGLNNASAMFRLNVLDIGVVALLNMSKTWYCKRYTDHGQESLLNAANASVDEFARLEVTGLVV